MLETETISPPPAAAPTAPPPPAPTPPSASALERRITVVAVILPFIGFVAALWLLWGGAVTVRDLAILAVAYLTSRLA